MIKKFILLCIALLTPLPLHAHPVTWKGGHALMVKEDALVQSVTYHHSLNFDWSLGVRQIKIKQDENQLLMGQSNWLLNRWNAEASQGNLYILSSLGVSNQDKDPNLISHLGLQADWETRKVYTYFKADYISLDTPLVTLRGRLGIAPYVADFNQVHTWLMLQIDDEVRNQQHHITLMPVIRVFHDNFLLELGHDLKDKLFLAAMLHI